jgi:hypothetical protein
VFFCFSDDDFETKFLRCVLPKAIAERVPEKRVAVLKKRQPAPKHRNEKLSAGTSTLPAHNSSTGGAASIQAAADHSGGQEVADAAVSLDRDDAETSYAIALSLGVEESTSIGNIRSVADAPQSSRRPSLNSSTLSDAHNVGVEATVSEVPSFRLMPSTEDVHEQVPVSYLSVDDCDAYPEATLTGGCSQPNPARDITAAAVGGDDSILDVSFYGDDVTHKPVSKHKSRIPSATARLQEMVEGDNIDFTPASKRSRALRGSKASSKAAHSELNVANEKAEALSRKSFAAAVRSARLGMQRPGVAAECR